MLFKALTKIVHLIWFDYSLKFTDCGSIQILLPLFYICIQLVSAYLEYSPNLPKFQHLAACYKYGPFFSNSPIYRVGQNNLLFLKLNKMEILFIRCSVGKILFLDFYLVLKVELVTPPIVHTLSKPFFGVCHYTYKHSRGFFFSPDLIPCNFYSFILNLALTQPPKTLIRVEGPHRWRNF